MATYQIANQTAFITFDFSTLVAGDIVQFQRGQTFYGSISITDSGTSVNPITFVAYGTGANPIISGLTSVTAWTNLGSNIWESTNAVSTLITCNMVVINGVNTPMGRTPNYTITSHSGSTSITSSSLTGTPNWTGAEVIIRTNEWLMNRRTISSQSGGTLSIGATSYEPGNNYKFFIQNDIRTLDTQNEWYYNPTTKKISIYSTSQPTSIEVSTVENLVLMQADYITFQNINFEGANNCGIYNDNFTCYNLTVQDCNISYSGQCGIQVKNQGILIERCTIDQSNNNGIFMKHHNSNTTIRSCSVSNSGMFPSIGDGYISNGMLVPNAAYATIDGNSVINSGFNGISTYGDNQLIQKNYVDNFCSVLQDGGGIYMNSNTTVTGNEVLQNIVQNGIGATAMSAYTSNQAMGIYLDQQSKLITVQGNVVSNCRGHGILANNVSYCNFRLNTLYNNDNQIKVTRYTTSPVVVSNIIQQNIFVAKSAQWTARFQSSISTTPEIIDATVFALDSNYYARPIDDYDTRPLPGYEAIEISQTGIGNEYLTFAAFQTRTGQEVHGGKSPQSITNDNDLRFEYNATTSAKTVSLSIPMIDMRGVQYASSVTLQPFTSVVLLKDANPAPAPKFLMKNGKYLVSRVTGKYFVATV